MAAEATGTATTRTLHPKRLLQLQRQLQYQVQLQQLYLRL